MEPLWFGQDWDETDLATEVELLDWLNKLVCSHTRRDSDHHRQENLSNIGSMAFRQMRA